jgi:predicted metal-dependent phosphoesterase TrpH
MRNTLAVVTVLKIDMHVHTKYSSDSKMEPDKIVEICMQKGLDGVAFVNHNVLMPHKRYRDFVAFYGEEILTNAGELIGLNINEEIAPGKSIEETCDAIRKQGGIVIVPHPFDFFRKAIHTRIKEVRKPFVVETMNGRGIFSNWQAKIYAKQNNLPVCGGSDSHSYNELGACYTEAECDSAEKFLKLMQSGKTNSAGRPTPVWTIVLNRIFREI